VLAFKKGAEAQELNKNRPVRREDCVWRKMGWESENGRRAQTQRILTRLTRKLGSFFVRYSLTFHRLALDHCLFVEVGGDCLNAGRRGNTIRIALKMF
jgi:hypothetical protein